MAHGKRSKSRSLPVEHLRDFEFWTPQSHGVRHAVVIDIDRPDWRSLVEDPGLPAYSWAVATARGGQVGYLIEDLAERGGVAPLRLFDAVHENLRRLLQGDPDADPLGRCRNPFFSGANVSWKVAEPRTLTSLYEHLVAVGLWENASSKTTREDVDLVPGSRNCTLFLWADASTLSADELLTEVTRQAAEAGLPASEARTIWRSVLRRRTSGQARSVRGGVPSEPSSPSDAAWQAFSEWQAKRGRRGGSRNTEAQQEARAKGPAAASSVRSAEAAARREELRRVAAPLLAEGRSQRAVADALGVPQKTLSRALKEGEPSESPLEPQGYAVASTLTPPAPSVAVEPSEPAEAAEADVDPGVVGLGCLPPREGRERERDHHRSW